jgi:hypothetical protein
MPPFLPESEEQFTEHVAANPQVWYHYCQASAFADQMSAIQDHLREQTTLAQARYEEAANRSRATAPRYDVDQMVWLSAKNLKTLRPRKKLDWKNISPFRITEVLGPYTYKLNLLESMPIYSVFNID